MSTAVSMPRAQHYLIDIRLDSLDRILMDSGVSRSERCEIVQSIEDQIFEMLSEQGDELHRESVLQVLRSLDPPEAYCGDGMLPHLVERSSVATRHNSYSLSASSPTESAPAKHSGFAITSFVLAMLSIPTLIIMPLGALLSLIGFIFALVAFWSIASSPAQLRGRWMAIVSCVVFALHVCLVGMLLFVSLA